MNSDGDCKLPMTDEEIDMVGEPLYDCFIPTADAQDERHSSDINNDVICSAWPSGPALTAKEIEMVGVPLYHCVMPAAQGEFNQYNTISPPSENDNEKDSNGEEEDYEDADKVSIVECCQQDLTNEKRNDRPMAYQQAAVTPFDDDGATGNAPLAMVCQPLPNDTSNINCDMNSGGDYKLPMTGLFMDHSKCSEATISASEVSEAPNHLFFHQSDTSSVSSATAECTAHEKRDIIKQQTSFIEVNYSNTCDGVNPLVKRATKLPAATDDNTTVTSSKKKKKKKSRLLNHVLFLPRLILHPRRLGKRVRSSFQRKTKNARDSARDDSDECHPSDINTAVNCNENKNASYSWGVALTAEEIEMVGEPLYDCIISTADAQNEHHQSDINNDIICYPWQSGPALTVKEIEIVGVPLYDCIVPAAQGELNQYNTISPPSDDYNEKDRKGEEEDYGDQCIELECSQQDEKRNDELTAYQQAAVTPFDDDRATADAPLAMVSQPLPNDIRNINCDMNSDGGYKLRMTDEEKRIIEELLADCSPRVQRIVNAHHMFTIPPPSYDDTDSDEEDSSEEEDDEY